MKQMETDKDNLAFSFYAHVEAMKKKLGKSSFRLYYDEMNTKIAYLKLLCYCRFQFAKQCNFKQLNRFP